MVSERYSNALNPFFKAVGKKAGVTPASAKGAFYGFLRSGRSLPAEHRAAYLKLIPNLTEALLDEIERTRKPVETVEPDVPPEALAKIATLERTVASLQAQVDKLTNAAGLDQGSENGTDDRGRPLLADRH